MSARRRMDLAEFQELGLLQELNRRALHPLGLALVLETDEAGERALWVWDERDDPEGICFAELTVDDVRRSRALDELWTERFGPRHDALGYMIQPIGAGAVCACCHDDDDDEESTP